MTLDNPYFSGREWRFNEVGSSGGDDFIVDMWRDGAFDDHGFTIVPQHTPKSVTQRDCPDCLSVAGKLCTDWTKSAVTGGWRGTGYVIEGAHTGRLAAMVQS